MNKIFALLFFFLCTYAKADYWTQKTAFGGTARHAATGFFLNGKGYIGTGGTFSIRKKDFWQWDPATDVWTQKADLGVSTGRSGAVAFAVGTKGYISTGFDNVIKKDLWQYDPSTNTWTQKTDFGGVGRHYAVAFELNGFGYLGTGNNNSSDFNDFWQYNPTTNSWTQKANFGGTARSSAVGFSVNGKGYIGIGYAGGAVSDFWEYNPATNTWTQKANFGGGTRSDGVGFGLCGKGYIGTGVSGSSVDKRDLWEYDPSTNTWTQKANFGGNAREDPVGFSDGTNYGYIGTGTDIFNEYGDFWQYTSDCNILPIGLTRFSAIPKGEEVEITWTTESEINNKYFTIEKSLDGSHFETLASVAGAGNSTSPLNYMLEDDHPFTGINYYRLRQTDYDGNFSLSGVINCTVTGNNMMRVLSVYPNPVHTNVVINLDLSENDDVEVNVFNSNGGSVFDQLFSLSDGIQQLDIPLQKLNPGIYLLRIHCEYGDYSQKIIKVN
ncbi:MAG TPA: T9SS type A sorting domain-containing protein [Chitinophagales bacterium]|nr:T9SS type A sorting domain-containing protein [Chitinophagales bacterium]